MTHRIKEIRALDKFVVSAIFQNGIEKYYDVSQLFSRHSQFRQLEEKNLFEQVVVDVGGYGISWNDELYLSAEEIWENGVDTGVVCETDVFEEIGYCLANARERVNITQKQLAEKVQIYQGDISKIERGLANPSVKTLQRLAEGMGMRLRVEFI